MKSIVKMILLFALAAAALVLLAVPLEKSPGEDAVGADKALFTEISPSAAVEWRTLCKKCGHTYAYTDASEVIGLTREEIHRRFPEWQIDSFSREYAALSRSIDGYCPEHFILRLRKEKLWLYKASEPDLSEARLFTFDPSVYSFDSEEQNALKKGIAFDSLRLLDSFLEAHLTSERLQTP